MKFVAASLPSALNFPSWVVLEKVGESFVCCVDWKDEVLIETLSTLSDVDFEKLLAMSGFGPVHWLACELCVSDDCYLRGLNKLFPGGIPFKARFPTVVMSGKPCFEVRNSDLSRRRALLTEVYQHVGVPFSLWCGLANQGVAAVPCEFVEILG